MANWWIKDENGQPSVIITLVAVSFVATTAAYLLSIVEKVGSLSIRAFDPAAAGAYFGAVLAAYVGHRWVDSRAPSANPTLPAAGVAPPLARHV
jgi:hypothetical protein